MSRGGLDLAGGVGTLGRPAWLVRAAPSTRALELLNVVIIAWVGLLVRWPELMLVPRFTDEVDEVIPGLRIARGLALPLTSHEPYIGALFNYLVAGMFWLLGPRIEAGRLLVLLVGTLTIVPTYLLGRSIGGRLVGLLAAMLLAASSTHIAVNSHVAYSHSTTPLFSTTGLWLLHRAVMTRSGRLLAASGFVLGLAVQTHPSALALGPGLAAYLLWKGRPLIGRWLVAASAGALLAIGNLLVFNLASGLASVSRAAHEADRYVAYEPFTLGGWASRFVLLLREYAAGLGGLVSEFVQPAALLRPGVAAYAVLGLVGLGLLYRRREWLPCLALLSGLLGISLLSGNFLPVVVRGRHYVPLLPVGYVAIAVALQALHGAIARLTRRRPWLADLAVGGFALLLFVSPLLMLRSYYEHAQRDGRTNRLIFATADSILRGGSLHDRVYLDSTLQQERTLSGGSLLNNLEAILEIRGQAFETSDGPPTGLPADGRPHRLVLRGDSVGAASGRYLLEPLPGEPGPGAPIRVFRAIRPARS